MIPKEVDSGLLKAMDQGIEMANKRSSGQFNGVLGSLPKDAARVLDDIVAHLRSYLFDNRGLKEEEIRTTDKGVSVAPKWRHDEGARVAVGVLNTILSAVRVRNGQFTLDGKPLSKADAVALLLTGPDSPRRRERQRTNAKKGSQARTEGRRNRETRWLELARPLRAKHPEWSDSTLARNVALSKDVYLTASTIRQALRKHGLSKKAAR